MSTAIIANLTKFKRGDSGTGPGAATAGANVGTGGGTCGAVTVSAGASVGVYKARIIAAIAAGGAFRLEDPDSNIVGTGKVGTAYSGGGLAFTISDGAPDFAENDYIPITVTSTTAEAFTEVPGVFDIALAPPKAPSIDVTHLGSTAREKMGGLQDFGSATVQMLYYEGNAVQEAMEDEAGTNVVRNYQILHPNGVNGYLCSLVLTAMGPSGYNVDGKLIRTATFEVSGAPTRL
jgi:tail tube protein